MTHRSWIEQWSLSYHLDCQYAAQRAMFPTANFFPHMLFTSAKISVGSSNSSSEIFAFLGCYAAYPRLVNSYWRLGTPVGVIFEYLTLKMAPTGCRETSVINTKLRCVKSSKIEDLIYMEAEACNHAATLVTRILLWKLSVAYWTRNSAPLMKCVDSWLCWYNVTTIPVMNRLNPIQAFISAHCLCGVQISIILLSSPTSSKWPVFLGYPINPLKTELSVLYKDSVRTAL
jgi:hypothetical protein